MRNGISRDRTKPVRTRLARQVVAARPARIRVGSLDADPLATLLEHQQRLAGESLGQLLGVGRWLGAKRRELACERMFA